LGGSVLPGCVGGCRGVGVRVVRAAGGMDGARVNEERPPRQGGCNPRREGQQSGPPQADLSVLCSSHTELLFPVRKKRVPQNPLSRSVPESIQPSYRNPPSARSPVSLDAWRGNPLGVLGILGKSVKRSPSTG